MKALFAAALCIGLTIAAASCQRVDANEVRLSMGVVRGATNDGVRRFLSIPYAAAPVGALRFRAPQPVTPWSGVRAATEHGPLCTQNAAGAEWGPWTGGLAPRGPVSEDCLTLSVWAPASQPDANLPVMFWIPGGGLTDGGEGMPVYDGAALAQRGVIVVTINYRVNAFGLLAHPALEREPDGAYGNYALRDALAALRWVHDNIEAFGGDASKVTIAGQSAGAALAYAMLDAPPAHGLFRGAILQSFPPGAFSLGDRAAAEAIGQRIATELGAPNLAALRAVPPERLLQANGDGLDFFVDGVLITDPHFATPPFANDVPILMGVTADEDSWMSPNLASYRRAVTEHGTAFARLYPAANDAEALDASLRSTREGQIVALQRFARGHAAPTYLYLWDHPMPGPEAARWRAFHSSEVPYMLGSLNTLPERPFTRRDHDISNVMLDYWASFVKTGDPNSSALARWPRAEGEAPTLMELGDRFAPLPVLSETNTAFWNARYDARGEYRF